MTADVQTAGRGRHGRTWHAPQGRALLMSLVLRETTELLPIAAAVAVAEAIGPETTIKWPNDVLVEGRKVAGVLIERRAGENWTVLGIGVNVAIAEFPPELAATAGSLGRSPDDIEPLLGQLVHGLGHWCAATATGVIAAWSPRDALRDREITWLHGRGIAHGLDASGRLLVEQSSGEVVALDAGEV